MDRAKIESVANKLFLQIQAMLINKKIPNEVIRRFNYICAEHSDMKIEFDDCLRQFKELRRKVIDHRVKFSKEDVRRIRKVFRTEGNYSVTKTKKLLRKEYIEISERYIYMLCDDIIKQRKRIKETNKNH